MKELRLDLTTIKSKMEKGEPIVSLTPGETYSISIGIALTRLRLIGMHFDTNKCFLKPSAMVGIRKIVQVYNETPGGQLLIVGHTDTVIDESYNMNLSIERAKAVQAYLKDDVDAWLAWFSDSKSSEKKWGNSEINQMISAFPCEHTVAGFQQWSNDTRGTTLEIDNDPGTNTRKALVEAYMAIDGTTLPPTSSTTIHGCGEYFPVDDLGDNVPDESNRRVEVFVFPGAITPPCPGERGRRDEPEYPQWRDMVTRTIDFESDDTVLDIAVISDINAKTKLHILDASGNILRTYDESAADLIGSTLKFAIPTTSLPSQTQLVIEQWGDKIYHGKLFNPKDVATALRFGNTALAVSLIYGDDSDSGSGIVDSPSISAESFSGSSAESSSLSSSADRLRILLDDFSEGGTTPCKLDKSHPRVAALTVKLFNYLPGFSAGLQVSSDPLDPGKPYLIGDYSLDGADAGGYQLDIFIPDTSLPEDSPGYILKINQVFNFNTTLTPWGLNSLSFHPRLTAIAPVPKTAGSNMIWTFKLDLAFLDVTERTVRKNVNYTYLHSMLNSITAARVLEDPCKPGADGNPVTYLLLSSKAEIPAVCSSTPNAVDVLVFFQNERATLPDADHNDMSSMTRLLSSSFSEKGEYSLLAPSETYTDYPSWAWAEQLKQSGANLLMVIPSTGSVSAAGEATMHFGHFGENAKNGFKRLSKMIKTLRANKVDWRGTPEYTLRKLVISGWSSGMNTVWQWFARDPENRVDGIFAFDAVGHSRSSPEGGNGEKKWFPLPGEFEGWMNKKPTRKLAFLNGSYSQLSAIEAVKHLRKPSVGKSGNVLLNEPEASDYWYQKNSEYSKARRITVMRKLGLANETEYDLNVYPDYITPGDPDTVCIKEKGTILMYHHYTLSLCRRGNPADIAVFNFLNNRKIPPEWENYSLSQWEAADMLIRLCGQPTQRSAGDWSEFKLNVKVLSNTTTEQNPAGRTRHNWSCAGHIVIDGVRKGYFQLVLEKAKAAGLFT